MTKNTETEIKFLEIDVLSLKTKLSELHAEDLGEDLYREVIFYSKNSDFRKEKKIVRLRRTKNGNFLTYKEHPKVGSSTSIEIEITVDNEEKTIAFLEKLGLIAFRIQEKKRHSFLIDSIRVDVDTWPGIPTYVELEGDDEESLIKLSQKLELKAEFHREAAGKILEKFYNINIHELRFFTFDKVE